MSTIGTTYDDPGLADKSIERDAALGAYLRRDLSGTTGLLLLLPAFALIFGAFPVFDFNRLRRARPDGAVPIAAGIFDVFLRFLGLFGGQRD